MAKKVFWRAAEDGNSPKVAAPCPFMGVTINNKDEFVELITGRLYHWHDKEHTRGCYPNYVFSTASPNVKLLFGHFIAAPVNQKTGKPFRWAIYDEKKDRVVKYLSFNDNFQDIFSLLQDEEVINRQADALTRLCWKNGGLTFSIQ